MPEFIQTDVRGAVATVSLNRSDLHNAFNEAVIAELSEVFSALRAQSGLRAIVLAAAGKSFCAGADLNWMKKMADYTFDENVRDAEALFDMLQTIRTMPVPVIARVHGAAFGGGVGLLAACDMAVASENATFCLSEVKLGLLPAVISPFVLAKTGTAAAQRYFLTAERFNAQTAQQIGLVCEVAPDEAALDARITALTDAIVQNGPEAVAAGKTLIDRVGGLDWAAARTVTTRMIAERRASNEGQEGMKAFLDKRPPRWQQAGQPV